MTQFKEPALERGVFGLLRDFFADRDGATAIEYALIGGSLSIVITIMVFGIGDALEGILQNVADGFN